MHAKLHASTKIAWICYNQGLGTRKGQINNMNKV